MAKKELTGHSTKSMKQFNIILFVCILSIIVGCNTDKAPPVDKTPKVAVKIPAVDGDNLFALVEKQLTFGHRIPGTPEHIACKDWIVETMTSHGATVIEQPFKASFFDVKDADAYNIIASFNPNHKHRILLAAHYDSRAVAEKDSDASMKSKPIMGADDGGSGVAALIEIGRSISENPIDMGVDMIFFDAEDNGVSFSGEGWCLGSKYWAQHKHVANYQPKFGILLDMVGSKGAVFPKELLSQTYAKKYQDKIWQLAQRMGYSDYFIDTKIGGVEDDHKYVNESGIPMLDIINYDVADNEFGHYHHTHKDDISVIDKRTLRVVTQVVTTALYKESERTL